MSNPITEQILGAWDEAEASVEESPETVEPVETTETEEAEDEIVSGDEVEETEEEEVSEEPGEEVEEEEEPSEEEQAEEPSGAEEDLPVAFASDDPSVQAFLAQHGNDVETALREAAKFQSVLGRQGRELGQLRQRNAELETEVERATLFQGNGLGLSAEQQEWIEEASTSDNPIGYVQAAVEAGEFGLARAVLDHAELPAGQVVRIVQAIDRAETLAQPVEETPPLNRDVLMEVLVEHYPEMPRFETEMVSTIQVLGEDHPLVALSRSDEPSEAAQGIIGLYEIARAKTATVTSTRDEVKKSKRATADAVRSQAQVSSSQASPQRQQVARQREIMPGLTLEALDAEFQAQ